VWWADDGALPAVGYVDQRKLPHEVARSLATNVDEVVAAIATLGVRGAPAIGVFGAYGIALARLLHRSDDDFARVSAEYDKQFSDEQAGSLARWFASRRSSSSMIRSLPWTWPPTHGSAPPCARTPRRQPSSS